MRDLRTIVEQDFSISKYASDLLGETHWVIHESFTYRLSGDLSDFHIIIPAGYVFKQWHLPPCILCAMGVNILSVLILYTYLHEHRTLAYKDKRITLSKKGLHDVFMSFIKRFDIGLIRRTLVAFLFKIYHHKPLDKGYKIKKQAIAFFLTEYRKMHGYFK